MWPWGHLGLGYLLALPYLLATDSHGDRAVAALAVGTQFPDAVDKPLAWTVSVLPYGRTLAHSLFAVAAVAVALRWLSVAVTLRRAFLVGWLTHLAGDAFYPVLAGDFGAAAFVAWPLLPLPAPEVGQSFLAHLRNLSLTGETTLELGLFAVATAAFLVVRGRSSEAGAAVSRAD
jgi:hypothetical protein